jgi:putative PEP-CTERM system integral membrane protein
MKDPALLEQIGPRQYRLRVFPILPMRISFDQQRSRSLVDEAPPMHMWLAWRQLAAGDSWPMPQLAFLRNVYRDGASQRLVNGQPMAAGVDDWLPAVLPASAPVEPQAHQVDLPGGQTVLAIPAGQARLPDLPTGLRLAVVVDRSRSMQAHASQVSAALEQLKAMDQLAPPVDVYLTASPYRGEEASIVPLESLNPQDIVYFGGQNAAELIAQFDTLRNAPRPSPDYDAVIVLTDGTGYELGASDVHAAIPPFPVWVVHLGGDIPLGYDDRTLETIQASGGGVAGVLDEALARLAIALGSGSELDSGAAPVVDLVDGYQWIVLPTSQAAAAIPAGVQAQSHQASEPFAALAARRLVLAEMQRHAGSIEQLETLDGLHALAMDYEIVTPYSSMIVLVSWDQQLMLDQLSELGDRYQREVEELRETTPSSPVPLAGVPEPHEWLLLGLVVALLVYLGLTKRAEVQRV